MAKIEFITYGCTLNQSDSEVMQGLLVKAGHEIVETGEDLMVINTCTVKGPTESKFWTLLKNQIDNGKKIVIAGCIPQAEQSLLKKELASVSVIGTRHLGDIVHVVEETLEGNVVQLVDVVSQERLNLPKIRRNSVVEIIPICEGCLGACSYCKTKQARGDLVSYALKEVVHQAETAIAEGVKEIWLTAQDTGAYGKDIGTDIIELVTSVCSIKGDFFVRIGMMNPEYVKDNVERLISLFDKHEKLFKFIHIPVQAGNDRILKLMNRKYTVQEFKESVQALNSAEISVATDIICGFPTETAKEFEDSLNLIREFRFDVVNRSKYWPRPGTKAAEMEQVPRKEINRRSALLKDVFEDRLIEMNHEWIDWKGRVLIDEKGTGGTMKGRNYAYKQVVVKNKEFGIFTIVKINKVGVFYLEAE